MLCDIIVGDCAGEFHGRHTMIVYFVRIGPGFPANGDRTPIATETECGSRERSVAMRVPGVNFRAVGKK